MANDLQRFFTAGQQACIRHRLQVPDAILETFFDTHEDDTPCPYAREDVAAVIDTLCNGRGLIAAESIHRLITRDVLRECIEGSTWAASVADGTPEGDRKFTGALTTLRHTADKIEKRYGIRVEVPDY